MTEVKGDFFYSEIVEIKPDSFIQYFQKLITTGSRRFILEQKDLTVYGTELDISSPQALSNLMKNGTPLMDAIAFLSYPKPPLNILKDPASIRSAALKEAQFINVAKSLYFFYFMYLVRGNSGDDDTIIVSPNVPAFLPNVMGFNGTIGKYRNLIASFQLNKMPANWIRLIKIKELANETQQRFSLQVAGHRMLKPFMYFKPEGPKARELQEVFNAVRDFAKKGPTWDVHSITRTAEVGSILGPLNANLGNLMLDVFSLAQLTEMRDNKLIYAIPKRTYGFDTYTTYNSDTFRGFTDYIFRNNTERV